MPDNELRALAEIIAKWIEPATGLKQVYLFGSRVRGDHRPDSDVDLRIFMEEWEPDEAAARWWMDQNANDFAELKARLPGPLALHRDTPDLADVAIRAAANDPVLRVGKVVCVRTPPKKYERIGTATGGVRSPAPASPHCRPGPLLGYRQHVAQASSPARFSAAQSCRW
jgi:predicted nucleotidyltransferase